MCEVVQRAVNLICIQGKSIKLGETVVQIPTFFSLGFGGCLKHLVVVESAVLSTYKISGGMLCCKLKKISSCGANK